jgi:hypothetical protein
MKIQHFRMAVPLTVLLALICFLPACSNKTEDTTKQEGSSSTNAETSPSMKQKRDTIGQVMGPVVICHDDLKRLYNWNGESGISKLSDKASMMRIREGSGVEFHCSDMAVGNLQFWGSFVWAAKEVRIQQGRMVYPPTP